MTSDAGLIGWSLAEPGRYSRPPVRVMASVSKRCRPAEPIGLKIAMTP